MSGRAAAGTGPEHLGFTPGLRGPRAAHQQRELGQGLPSEPDSLEAPPPAPLLPAAGTSPCPAPAPDGGPVPHQRAARVVVQASSLRPGDWLSSLFLGISLSAPLKRGQSDGGGLCSLSGTWLSRAHCGGSGRNSKETKHTHTPCPFPGFFLFSI